jgi:hypothetical protein
MVFRILIPNNALEEVVSARISAAKQTKAALNTTQHVLTLKNLLCGTISSETDQTSISLSTHYQADVPTVYCPRNYAELLTNTREQSANSKRGIAENPGSDALVRLDSGGREICFKSASSAQLLTSEYWS